MTAIAGLWLFERGPDVADRCARMLSAQEKYGPDARGSWAEGGVAVGRQLKRVLPEDKFDRQPLIGGGGNYVLVADVRLDNRTELADALRIPETTARDQCDAAILLVALEQWGDSCFDRLVGDYAFALWDKDRRRLLLARDPLGAKPLHYHRGNGFVAFASMPKGLHALPEVPYEADEERVAELLVLLPEAGTRSFFRGIERVPPGHFVIVTAANIASRRHWEPAPRTIKLRDADEYAEALRHHLDEAVACRLRGAKDVGTHLSGGFDSSAVTATAARLLAPSGRRVVAFTAVPREGYTGPVPRNRFGDERVHAAATAALYPNVEHILVHSDKRSPFDDIDRFMLLADRPPVGVCNIGWDFAINDAARDRKLPVLLSGGFGNMTTSYDGRQLLPELIRSGRLVRWWHEASALVRSGHVRWRHALAQSFGPWVPAPLWHFLKRISERDYAVLSYSAIKTSRLSELALARRARERNLDFSYRPWKDSVAMRLWVLRRADPGTAFKAVLAGWGIDVRDPTADRRLIEFCLSIPTEQFLHDGILRALPRRALSDRLPPMVLNETRTGYQTADWHETLTAARENLGAEVARLEDCAPATKTLDLARMRRLIEKWPDTGWEREETIQSYRLALMRGVAAGRFLRRTTRANK